MPQIQEDIISLLIDNPTLTQFEMSSMLGVTDRTIRRNLKTLIDNNYIKRTGSKKNGKWEVIKK